jgi:hypothetical protein
MEYTKPVAPPNNQPFAFPLPPEIKPPTNNEINETAVTTNCKDASPVSVKRKIIEKIRLLTTATKKILKTPYRIEAPIFFVSMVILPLQIDKPFRIACFSLVRAYSDRLEFRIEKVKIQTIKEIVYSKGESSWLNI